MAVTESQAQDLMAEFLVDHPEYQCHVGMKKDVPVMSTPAVYKFAEWSVKKGYTTAENARKGIRIFEKVREQARRGE